MQLLYAHPLDQQAFSNLERAKKMMVSPDYLYIYFFFNLRVFIKE